MIRFYHYCQDNYHFNRMARYCTFQPNTTSKLQPLDQGIIENIKVYYWKQVLSNVLSHINSNKGSPPTISAITASINVLDCCYWIASAVQNVTPNTVTRHFVHAGFPQSPSIALPPQIVTDELQALVTAVSYSLSLLEPVTVTEFIYVI